MDSSRIAGEDNQVHWHGGRRSIRSVARSIDRVDRFDRFGMIFDFLETSGSSRSVRCQSFSSVRCLEAAKMAKNRKTNFLSFSVRSVRYSVQFDRYCVRGSWWTALVKSFTYKNGIAHQIARSPILSNFNRRVIIVNAVEKVFVLIQRNF